MRKETIIFEKIYPFKYWDFQYIQGYISVTIFETVNHNWFRKKIRYSYTITTPQISGCLDGSYMYRSILNSKKEILKQIIENSILKVKNGSKDPFQTLEKYDF